MADIKDFKHAIVRQKILDAVRKDLIGPTSDCEQLNEVPTSSYITGLLYPADTDVTEDENYNDVEFTEKNFDADGETLEVGIFEEEEPEDRVKGGFQKPSSIGVSFYVSDDVQKVNAYINWGKYYAEQVQGEVIDETLEEDAENKKKKKHTIYIREQMNDVVEIDFNLMGRSKQIPLESNGNVYIYVMKMQLDNGYKMVSVYLHNNDKSDGNEKEYAKVMFQVEMLIADDLMSPIFVPEYLCRKVELEDEYYYKGRPVYARGRGCAATWEKKAEEINATAIKSSFIPDYEIPSVSAQIDDMPEHAFSMLRMGSPKKKSEVIQNLRTLTEMYGSWITDALTNDEAMHDDKFKATGQTIIDKCNDANRRMNAGIDLIENNDKVYQAFVFMNQAMYLQRSITAFSKDYGNGIPCSLKFNSISMDKAGQTLTAGDQVKFTVDVTDDTGVASVKMVLKNVNSELSSKDDVDCYMQNVEGTSKYEYTYTITENDYPCEWYVSSIEARDVYNNMLYTSTERQTSGRELPLMYDYYFNVTQNGTFVQPNVNVMFSYINADMEWEIKTIEVPRRTKLSKALEKFDTGVKFDDAKITGWTMVGYPDSDTIVSNNTTFLANYNTNIVEKYVYSYSPDVGSKCLYKETSFVKKGQKIELPTVIPGVKNVKWIKTEELDELIKNGYIINTDTGSYYFEADAEVDDSVPPTDDNNGSTGGNNNQTTTDGNKGNNEGTKLSSDKIQEAVAAITTAKAGDTYTVDMSDATVVPKDVLEAAKGKDVDIVLDMNGYKWTINGNNIQADNLKDINLSVDTDSDAIPDDVISELAGNNPVKQISLAYSGDFGFKASLTYNIGSEYAGKYGNLYYYDSTGRMIFQNAGAIDADGNISLNFSHASEYAVVIADYAVTTENADNTATGGIATGDSTPIALYAVLCVMAIALAGIAAVTRKKNV